jgi:hypothetical protein
MKPEDYFNWTPERLEKLRTMWPDPAFPTYVHIADAIGCPDADCVRKKGLREGLTAAARKQARDEATKAYLEVGPTAFRMPKKRIATSQWTDDLVRDLIKAWYDPSYADAGEIARKALPKGLFSRMAVKSKAERLGLGTRNVGLSNRGHKALSVILPLTREPDVTVVQTDSVLDLPPVMMPIGNPNRPLQKSSPPPRGKCNWPIGVPGHKQFRFCGKKSCRVTKNTSPQTTKLSSYCSDHHSLAYLPQAKRG